MRTPGQYFTLLRQMGPGWLLYRTGNAFRRRAGCLRRASPVMTWDQLPAPALALRIRTGALAVPVTWGNACLEEAEAILQGKFRVFSDRTVAAGIPPDWQVNQLDASRGSSARGYAGAKPQPDVRHWSDISDAGGDDIKGVWELSRFSWAYALVRAHGRTGDQRFVDVFWSLFADWCRQNPPNAGPNWMCGQEATFRLMAVVFAVENLGLPEPHRTELARFVVASARRIAAHLDYALSQDNNHGISECVGLITTGLLLPGEKSAANWLARGTRLLEAQLDRLVYDDGGFSQHSLVYHRVLLHDLCWCRWRLNRAGRASPAWLDASAERALAHLMAVTDPGTGLAPLYGSNDGANILPLAEAEYLDMRPVVQMGSALFNGYLPLQAGPWDEATAWFKPGWESLPRSDWTMPPTWHAPIAGCYQLCRGRDRLFFRCPTQFRHRPAQADMLHVDVWRDGRAIAFDGGSFSYNSLERFTELGAAIHHNVLTVDGIEPMKKFSRFLYLPWLKGTAALDDDNSFKCSHDGYAALGIAWIRKVSTGVSGGFVVHDFVRGAAGHRLKWHWRLADAPWQKCGNQAVEAHAPGLDYRIRWSGAAVSQLICADEISAHGWWAPHYGAVQPAVALLIEAEVQSDIEWITEFQPLS